MARWRIDNRTANDLPQLKRCYGVVMGIFFPEESLIGVGGSRNFSIAATAGQRDDLACFGTGRRGKNVFKKRENRKDLPFYLCPSRFLIRNVIHRRT